MANYKGITFAKGYDRSFAEFKEEFSSTEIFKSLYPKQREVELKKAYKIAKDGKLPASNKKREQPNAS